MKNKSNFLTIIMIALIASGVIDFNNIKPLDIVIIVLLLVDVVLTIREGNH